MYDYKTAAYNVRKRIIELGYIAGKNGAHFGSSLSMVEIFLCIYNEIVNIDKIIKKDDFRDRVILSKGHGALCLFSILEYFKMLDTKKVETFNTNGTKFFSHAHKNLDDCIEFSGGSLGLGLSMATGIAIALKSKKSDAKVICVIGDGECDEGIVWESLMTAAHQNLSNLLIFVDNNGFQSDGKKENILNLFSLKNKFESFQCSTVECDGNSTESLLEAYNSIKNTKKPKVIIANTIKGRGVDFMESNGDWHYGILNEKLYSKAIDSIKSRD